MNDTVNHTVSIVDFSPSINYTAHECRLINLICSREIVFEMPAGSRRLTVTLLFDPQEYHSGQTYHPDLAFESADSLWQVSFKETRTLYDLLEMIDDTDSFSQIPVELFPDEIVWAVTEAFLSRGLSQAEAVTGCPIAIAPPDPVAFSSSSHFKAALKIHFGSEDETKQVHGVFMIPFDAPCIALFEQFAERFPVKKWSGFPLLQLKKTVGFEAGCLTVKNDELKGVEVGDLLIPELWYPADGHLHMGIRPHRFLCDFDGKSMTINANIRNPLPLANQPIKPNIQELQTGDNMLQSDTPLAQEAEHGDENSQTPEAAQPVNMDMNLIFEVGQLSMSVEDIGQLTEGKVIQLPRKIADGALVDVKVNNQVIAKGKIVGSDDFLAVQITKLA